MADVIKVGVLGAHGKVGSEVCAAVEAADDLELVARIDAGDPIEELLSSGAEAVVERRTVPGEDADVGLAEVERALDRLRLEDPTVDATARLVIAREPWRLDAAGPAADLASVLERALGGSAGERFNAPFWLEAPLWQAAGIPALVCGPAGGGLHAADEWVDLRQVRAFVEALPGVLREWADARRAH